MLHKKIVNLTNTAKKVIRFAAAFALVTLMSGLYASAETQADPALNGEWLWKEEGVVSFDNGKIIMLNVSDNTMMRGTYITTSGTTYDQVHSIFYEEYDFESGKWVTMDNAESSSDSYFIPDSNTLLLAEDGEFLTFKRGSFLKEYKEKIASAVKQELVKKEKTLVVWSFTDELESMTSNLKYGYKKNHPDIELEYSFTPTDQYPNKLDSVFSSGRGGPDVFALESSFVRKYVEQGKDYLLPLDDVYKKIKDKTTKYQIQVGSYNGHVYAMSWQICPGAVFYRRSLAKQILGTDNPADVQKYMSDFAKFRQLAELINQKSNGKVKTVASPADLFLAYKYSRKNPWIVDGKLVIDPAMEEYMETSKLIHGKGYDGNVWQWSEGWFAGMKDYLKDEHGEDIKVFCYFFPTWGLQYVLKPNAPDTSGDWAMCQGPAKYYWGGSWLAAYKGTKNPSAAKKMIEYLVSDDKFCKAYTKETGDLLSNLNTQEEMKNEYPDSYLSGQNSYAEFCEMAKDINGNLNQSTDMEIDGLWNEAVSAYINGEKTKNEALSKFKSDVKARLGF